MNTDTEDFAAIVAAQAGRLFARHATRATLETADGGALGGALWAAIEEAGLPLALLAEKGGGIGLPATTALALVQDAAGHALPAPLGESMLAAALAGRALDGPASLGVAAAGVARRVAWGGDSAWLLVEVDGALWLGRPGAAMARGRNLAGEPRDDIALDTLTETTRLAMPDWLAPDGLIAAGALVRSVQMAGAMRRVLAMSLDHARERQQFGRPIAKFQAVQHMLADAAGQVAASSALVANAAEAWGAPDFVLRAALAKARTSVAAGQVATIAHQVHAAMGFTQAHDLHFFTRRLWAWRDEFGSDAHWQGWLGRRVCAAGGAALWPAIVEATA